LTKNSSGENFSIYHHQTLDFQRASSVSDWHERCAVWPNAFVFFRFSDRRLNL